jgi:lipopolysaccharide transport system ATP-binding protein
MRMIAIEAQHLSKQFKIMAARRHDTLRDQLANSLKSWLRRPDASSAGRDTFWALRDVSFEIKEGETVGIIGRNGAGKSTLLKILSRITEPTGGRATIRGRVGSLLEVGTGFHAELSGRENLYLSGAILGMSRAEIEQKFDAIVAFAEIEQFVDTPVKHYSSGMYVRLAFAVAAHLDPDILLIDEVLAVGDLAFQTKCIEHAKRLQASNSTVLFVSHNMFSIKAMCQRVIYLSGGLVRFDGPPEEGIGLYEQENRLETAPWALNHVGADLDQLALRITSIEIMDEQGRRCHVFDYGRRMRIRLAFETRGEVKNASFGVSLFRSDSIACCNFNSAMDQFPVPSLNGTGSIELLTPPLKLVAELYAVTAIVRNATSGDLLTAQAGGSFHVRHEQLNTHYGVFHEAAEWSWGD